jgi:hypothetical protein
MATPQDIDPKTLAAIQAQLGMQPSPPSPPDAGPSDAGTAMLQSNLDKSPLFSAPRTVPQTVPQSPQSATGAAPVQGDFVNKPGGAATSGVTMPPMVKTPAGATSNVSPETRKLYDTAIQSQLAAPGEEANAEAAGNEKQASMLDQQAQALGEQMRISQIEQRKRSDALDAQMNDYKQAQAEAASQKVDPDRWWGSKSTAEKALGIVGLVLGSFGGIANGGHNTAVDVMNKFIDRDIDAQKHNIGLKQHNAEATMSIYDQKLKQFGDQNAADMATRGQMLEQFKLQTQAEALRSGSAMARAKAKAIAAQIQLEQAKIHQGLEQWHQSGVAGGITEKDRAVAANFVDKGMTPEDALKSALALRGVGSTSGLGAVPGKANAEKDAAAALTNGQTPQEMSLGERIEAGLAKAPLIGKAFQGTEGARKDLAQQEANIAPHFFAHKVGGLRTPEAQEAVVGSLMVRPGDSQARINQKMALRALVAKGQMNASQAAQYITPDEEEK